MNKKGITLIALIITIIVLLILVGVTVSISIGENGLIAETNKAKMEKESEIALEEIIMVVAGSIDNQGNYSSSLAKSNLETHLGGEVTDKGNGELRIKYKGYNFGIDSSGKVKKLPDINYSKLKIGDYVDYSPDSLKTSYDKFGEQYSGSTQNGSVGRDNLRWRILNINEDDNIVELISDGPTSTKVYFKGARGYNNGVTLLNHYCKTMYSNKEQGATARSLNIEDIQNKMKTDSNGKKAYESCTSGIGTVYKTGTRSYKNYRSYPLKWETDTLEVESNPKNPEVSEIIEYTVESDASTTKPKGENLTVTQTQWVISSASMKTNFEEADTRDIEKSKNMYYELLCNNGISAYWLASRQTDTESLYAKFGLRRVTTGTVGGIELLYSQNITHEGNSYIRPVVCLPADRINLNTEYNEATGWSLINK